MTSFQNCINKDFYDNILGLMIQESVHNFFKSLSKAGLKHVKSQNI